MPTYMGYNWGGCCRQREAPRYPADAVAAMTKSIVDRGGVVTWDMPYDMDTGRISPKCIGHLRAIGKALGTLNENAAEGSPP